MLDYQCDYVGKKVDTIKGCEQWDKSGELWSFFTEGGSKPGLGSIKPLLRPLEDLNKEEFLPIARALTRSGVIGRDFSQEEYYFTNRLKGRAISTYLLRELYKNHFDVEELVIEGLAHDLSTFNNEE